MDGQSQQKNRLNRRVGTEEHSVRNLTEEAYGRMKGFILASEYNKSGDKLAQRRIKVFPKEDGK